MAEGMKKKSKYKVFKPDPEDVGSFWIEACDPVKWHTEAAFFVDGVEYKLPAPQDNEPHRYTIKFDKKSGLLEYYIDGKRVEV